MDYAKQSGDIKIVEVRSSLAVGQEGANIELALIFWEKTLRHFGPLRSDPGFPPALANRAP